jgi:hypothetical protein
MPIGPGKFTAQQTSTASRRSSPSALRSPEENRQRSADVKPPVSKPMQVRGDPGDRAITGKYKY